MDWEPGNINYQGQESGVHRWQVDSELTLYWHPDWLHLAEDITGLHHRVPLEVPQGETASEAHALKAVERVVKTRRGGD
ncbi:hypothetical protein FCL40_08385 [Ferrimonas sediminicola]|uniref:Uncharacterized protein n=1 Tax=Ferrimonas sediminicola TaxID=2569538 RepID=A0A4U1BDY8_9GAMM|nr:hypothetical protein [Ferrimonas sediminicola]TKB49343.1 hypothetical protein FCL40_08385 [Ferrimonas sediminicola]